MSQDNESTNGNSKKRERKAWADRSPLDQEQSVLRSAQSLFDKLPGTRAKLRVINYLRDQALVCQEQEEKQAKEDFDARQQNLYQHNPFAAAISRQS